MQYGGMERKVDGTGGVPAGIIQFTDRLSEYLMRRWEAAKTAKKQYIEPKLELCQRLQEGETDPTVKALFEQAGEPDLDEGIVREKTAQLRAILEDALKPHGDRCWDLEPTPIPDLPREAKLGAVSLAMQMFAPDMAEIADVERVDPAQGEALRSQLEARVKLGAAELAKQVASMMKAEAERRCERLETLVEDQLTEGGWDDAISGFISDLSVYPFAVLKGPIYETVEVLEWDDAEAVQPQNGPRSRGVRVVEKVIPRFEAVSPWDIFWGPGSREFGDDYLVHRLRVDVSKLRTRAQGPGWITSRVEAAIREFVTTQQAPATTGTTDNSSTRAAYELRDLDVTAETRQIEMLELWDTVPGTYLAEWSARHEASLRDMGFGEIEAERWYPICATVLGRDVVRVTPVMDPLGRYPFHCASFELRPGAVCGKGMPEILEDIDRQARHAVRQLAVNLSFQARPMASHDTSGGAIPGQLTPGMIIEYDGRQTVGGRPPVEWWATPSCVVDCIQVLKRLHDRADDVTGIASFTYGSPKTSGAAETMGGLEMLRDSAQKGTKDVLGRIDGCVNGCLDQLVVLDYLYHPDASIRGDVRIVTKGSLQVALKEIRQRGQTELLGLAQNPMFSRHFKPTGVNDLLRARVRASEMPEDSIIVSDDELRQGLQAEAQAQAQARARMLGPSGPSGTPGRPRAPQPGVSGRG